MLQSRKQLLRFLALTLLIAVTIILARPLLNAAAAPAQQTGWTLVWADEFNGTGAPTSTNWNYHVGNGFNPGLAGFDGWGNGEWEWYRPQNCYQSGGNLVIKAEYLTTPTNIAGRDWYQFSCRITTDTKRTMTYGAIEARMQLPMNWGTWPAFWMMGDACDDTSTSSYNPAAGYYDRMASNWSSCGEIDIMEHRNSEAIIFHNLFWDSRTGLFPWDCCTTLNDPTQVSVANPGTFHTYRLQWTSTQLQWLIDGAVTKTINTSPANMEEFRNGYHLIMNLALSGAFTGGAQPNQAEFPLYMNIDYVRVYQAGGTPPPTTPPPTTPPPTTPPPTTPPPSGNLALNRPATGSASCNTNETPAKAVNGSVSGGNSDKFCSTATTKWLQVDLGSSVSVNQFVVKHAGAGGESTSFNTRAFNIQTSTDNVNWSTAVTVTANTANTSTHNITARNARYVRLNITQAQQTTGGAARIYEFEVYGGGGTPPPTTPPPTGDFTQGVVNVSSNQARVWFTPNGYTAGYVIIHYIHPGIGQQNVNMAWNAGAGRWEYLITGITAGQTLQYNFTYQKTGTQYDSAWFNWVKP